MFSSRPAAAVALVLLLAACAPKLERPGEATRFSGRVKGKQRTAVQIHVYERCSPRFYFLERCPGRLVGEAKLARPARFVVEADPETPDVSIFAFRGDPGAETQCTAAEVRVADAKKKLRLKLADGPCPVPLPKNEIRAH